MLNTYLYFGTDGTLKEQIQAPVRAGGTNSNAIFVYWEGLSNSITNVSIDYKDGVSGRYFDNHYIPSVNPNSPNENCIIPFNPKRDLSFFKYFTQYEFYVFNIPAELLAGDEHPIVFNVKFTELISGVLQDIVMGLSCLWCQGQAIQEDQLITIAQWNYLTTLLANYISPEEIDNLYVTKINPTTSGTFAHTGNATISGNIDVGGNLTVTGNIAAAEVDATDVKKNGATLATENYVNNYVTINASSGTFSDAEYAKLLTPIGGIYYSVNGQYYLKYLDDGTKIAFVSNLKDSSSETGVIKYTQSAVVVFKATKAWAVGSTQNTFYSRSKVDDLLDDKADKSTTYTKTQVNNLIAQIEQNQIQVVDISTYPTLADFLATTGQEGYEYLYPIDPSEAPTFVSGYYCYIWENSAWLLLGTTKIDLSDYYTKSQVDALDAQNVKLTGNQEIAGSKTFTNDIKRKYGNAGGYTAFGSVPGSNVPLNITWKADNNAAIVTLIRYEIALNGFRMSGNLLPFTSEGYNLGSATYKWNDAFIAGLLNNGTESITVKQIVDNFTDIANNKQDNLVSGTNIKTLNNESLLGSGNISYDIAFDEDSTNAVQNKVLKSAFDNLQAELNQLRAEFNETTVDVKTYTYNYLLTSAIPSAIDSQPVIESAGMDCVNVKGNSYVYNQLVQNGNFVDTSGWNSVRSSLSVSSNIGTITTTDTNNPYTEKRFNLVANHKYLFICQAKVNTEGNVALYAFYDNEGQSQNTTTNLTSFTTLSLFISPTITGTTNVDRFRVALLNTTVVGASCQVKNAQIFDLTQLGLDSATTTDEAIAGLMQLGINPYEYNAYNEGAIIDSKPTKLISGGFNIWDEEWEVGGLTQDGTLDNNTNRRTTTYIHIRPNTTYYQKCPSSAGGGRVAYYDKNKNVALTDSSIGLSANATFTTPNNAYYVRITFGVGYGTTYNNDICINISNATLNGTYRPYIAPTEYALDLQILRSAGSVQDDTKKVRIGVVDLGTLSWGIENGCFVSDGIGTTIKYQASNLLCSKYITHSPTYRDNLPDGQIMCTIQRYQIAVKDSSYSTAADFKTAMSGIYLYYELATPTDQPTIALPENIAIQKGGTLTAEYDGTSKAPSDFEFDIATSKIV